MYGHSKIHFFLKTPYKQRRSIFGTEQNSKEKCPHLSRVARKIDRDNRISERQKHRPTDRQKDSKVRGRVQGGKWGGVRGRVRVRVRGWLRGRP